MANPKNGYGPQRIDLDIKDCRRRGCECGNFSFVRRIAFYEIPELLRFAAQGQDMITAQDMVCLKCGKPQDVPNMQLYPSINRAARDEAAEKREGSESSGSADTDPAQPAAEKPMIELVRG
jgi:hypothetical protein